MRNKKGNGARNATANRKREETYCAHALAQDGAKRDEPRGVNGQMQRVGVHQHVRDKRSYRGRVAARDFAGKPSVARRNE